MYFNHLDILFGDTLAYLVWPFLHSGICLFLVLFHTVDVNFCKIFIYLFSRVNLPRSPTQTARTTILMVRSVSGMSRINNTQFTVGTEGSLLEWVVTECALS